MYKNIISYYQKYTRMFTYWISIFSIHSSCTLYEGVSHNKIFIRPHPPSDMHYAIKFATAYI